MTPNGISFLAPPEGYDDIEKARAVVVPFPYEGGVSYGLGAAGAPQAVLEASQQVEYYDEEADGEPFRAGIATLDTPEVPVDAAEMAALMTRTTEALLAQEKFPVILGGDHSITSGAVRGVMTHFSPLGVIQLDAHADLRDTFDESSLSHACVMARIREMTPHTLQVGIRSMDLEEARRIRNERLAVCTMRQWRQGSFDFESALAALPERVFITLDVDVFDWSVIAGTGTPEPGGVGWYEALDLLKMIFDAKTVVGCDVVELATRPHDINSPYAVAKLVYKMIGYKFSSLKRD